ncbi:uncharacterized protein LOC105735597 [Apis florea]|uniref:uncharacterized protein LOC105735597 n=1 Tax=Apis florea TaxID=7463 RepID=UPI0012FEBDAA|nr:uncharacterized protein LOC105735597 [Apis florea]
MNVERRVGTRRRESSQSRVLARRNRPIATTMPKLLGSSRSCRWTRYSVVTLRPTFRIRRKTGKGGLSFSERSECSERGRADGSTRPTPTQRSCLVKYRDAARKSAESSTTIQSSVSNVDRATVVVIDESDRKAASNDHPDHCDDHHVNHNNKDAENENDNDNNIHRQDWLEAGVHYSSTQIRLSGEDGDVIDGNRVNGFDRCENEKFGDFNVPR